MWKNKQKKLSGSGRKRKKFVTFIQRNNYFVVFTYYFLLTWKYTHNFAWIMAEVEVEMEETFETSTVRRKTVRQSFKIEEVSNCFALKI